MASYPNAIFEPRVVENLEGIEYNADDKKTLFAEDYNKSNDEILAIEQTLGAEVNGGFETLAARISELEALVAGINDNHFPVGTVYFNASDARNPSEILGFGTWESYSEGRTIVGISDSGTFSILGDEMGEEVHVLTVNELARHDHGASSNNVALQGGGNFEYTFNTGGVTVRRTSMTGNNKGHNNIQPSKVAMIWERVA